MKREQLEHIKTHKADARKQVAATKGGVSKMTQKQKDALLEAVCKMLRIID